MPQITGMQTFSKKTLASSELMMATNCDAYYQYSDGRDMLSMTLMQRDNLLRELEALAKVTQGKGSTETITEVDLVRTQTLLFDLSVIAEKNRFLNCSNQ